MSSPSYTPTVWVDDAPPAINANNLNHLEAGVEDAHERIDALGGGGSGAGADVGDVKMSAALTPPTGWLVCDGSEVSRATYSALFTAIGTAYGAGDGSTTFNLPDFRGRAPYGLGTHADVDSRGENEGVAVGLRRPKHKHTITDTGHTHGINDPGHTHPGQWQKNGGGNAAQYGEGTGNNGMQNLPSAATNITVQSTTTGVKVGPQTGFEPTDSSPYLVVQFFIKT